MSSSCSSCSINVLLTSGTGVFDFLSNLAAELCESSCTTTIYFQHPNPPLKLHPKLQWVALYSKEEFLSVLNEVDFVICHAGMGICMDLFKIKKKALVVINNERKDLHQIELGNYLRKYSKNCFFPHEVKKLSIEEFLGSVDYINFKNLRKLNFEKLNEHIK